VWDLARNRLEFQHVGGRTLTWLLPSNPSVGRASALRLQAHVPAARVVVYRLHRQATKIGAESIGPRRRDALRHHPGSAAELL
jgi:hypothetical protein